MKEDGRWFFLGAFLIASPALFFGSFAIFDHAHPEDRKVWLVLVAIAIAASMVSLLRNKISGIITVVYAGLASLFLLAIGTTHPVLLRFVICVVLAMAVVVGAILVGVKSFRRS